MTNTISVVIPIAPGELEWRELVLQLDLPDGSEIILAIGEEPEPDLSDLKIETELRMIPGGTGRAGQMNAGAKAANAEWLWFLHADSRMSKDTFSAMNSVLHTGDDALYFFDLKFHDGPGLLKLNEWLVRLRAGWLKIPFGDQGFLIKRSLFKKLELYREDLSYGEDHVFAWKVRQEGFPVKRANAGLMTSGRKYEKGGWGSVTLKHVRLTFAQALPQYGLLWKNRMKRWFS